MLVNQNNENAVIVRTIDRLGTELSGCFDALADGARDAAVEAGLVLMDLRERLVTHGAWTNDD